MKPIPIRKRPGSRAGFERGKAHHFGLPHSVVLWAEEGLFFLSVSANTIVQLSRTPRGTLVSLLSAIKCQLSGFSVRSGGNAGCCEEPGPAAGALAAAAQQGLHHGTGVRSPPVCCGRIHLLFLQQNNLCRSTNVCHFAYILLIFFLS